VAKGGKPDPNDAVGIRKNDVRAVLNRNLLSTILTCRAVALRQGFAGPGASPPKLQRGRAQGRA
jgi:hypothetical protein